MVKSFLQKKDNSKNEIINFEQLSIDLSNLTTSTIKQPKIQETSTLKLIKCFTVKKMITQSVEMILKGNHTCVK